MESVTASTDLASAVIGSTIVLVLALVVLNQRRNKALGQLTDEQIKALGERTDTQIEALREQTDRNIQALGERTDRNIKELREQTDRRIAESQQLTKEWREQTERHIEALKVHTDHRVDRAEDRVVHNDHTGADTRERVARLETQVSVASPDNTPVSKTPSEQPALSARSTTTASPLPAPP